MNETQDFETKLKAARDILEKLSNPEITLQSSVEEYKKGMKALKEASKMLEDAKEEYLKMSGENI